MRYTIHDRVVLARAPDGPLASHIAAFANSIAAQGYSTQSLKYHVRLVAGFSRWLGRNGIELRNVCPDQAARYLRYRARHVRPGPGDRAALKHLIAFLDRERLIPAQRTPARRLTPVESCTLAYVEYLREVRALSKATIINYTPFIREFLEDCFGDGRVRLSRLRAGDVVSFVQCQAPRLHLKRAKLMTTALRSFLRYACFRGDMTLDLAAAVPVVANWSMQSIPRGIPPEQIQQLLVSIDRRTAVGRRDYAIILLLARLGLRSGEVAFLKLDDIDWNTGVLSVRGKSGQRNGLPLPADVGKAIAAYLRYGRPQSTSRRVFLRAKAPITGFRSACGVGSIVRHSLQRTGINAPTTGAHQFRHALASQMLRHGVVV
ncbi:putative integrase/recombinase y4rA (plasmid) [Cupriavidus taiwanensis]|uniref:Putative integrase/recombinase y4rA n=1 Tax=Cupriavidus taiwanensis TaxID=164546 RepID=A0A375IA99_9BURK|nr:tyrosine-type recombinase/integrase [Cupriavidus taiwanensis]SPK70439.1 putative integrase/recombinase y4rA [Cupriavidus taiwanensis]SPK77542.1 putative integrase/recombinase y4rA [Cupriavidus taiwanensis]